MSHLTSQGGLVEACPVCGSLSYGCSPSVAVGYPWLCRYGKFSGGPGRLGEDPGSEG